VATGAAPPGLPGAGAKQQEAGMTPVWKKMQRGGRMAAPSE